MPHEYISVGIRPFLNIFDIFYAFSNVLLVLLYGMEWQRWSCTNVFSVFSSNTLAHWLNWLQPSELSLMLFHSLICCLRVCVSGCIMQSFLPQPRSDNHK